MQYIEFVSTRNQTGSPLLEWAANIELKKRGLYRKFHAISSGTLVDCINEGHVPLDVKVEFIQRAIEHGFFGKTTDCVKSTLETYNLDYINQLYSNSLTEFLNRETLYKTKVYQRFGAPEKPFPEQTKVSHDVVAIFAVSRSCLERVLEIYHGVANPPLIAHYSSYAKGKPSKASLTVWYGEAAFERFMNELVSQMPACISRLLSELHHNNASAQGRSYRSKALYVKPQPSHQPPWDARFPELLARLPRQENSSPS